MRIFPMKISYHALVCAAMLCGTAFSKSGKQAENFQERLAGTKSSYNFSKEDQSPAYRFREKHTSKALSSSAIPAVTTIQTNIPFANKEASVLASLKLIANPRDSKYRISSTVFMDNKKNIYGLASWEKIDDKYDVGIYGGKDSLNKSISLDSFFLSRKMSQMSGYIKLKRKNISMRAGVLFYIFNIDGYFWGNTNRIGVYIETDNQWRTLRNSIIVGALQMPKIKDSSLFTMFVGDSIYMTNILPFKGRGVVVPAVLNFSFMQTLGKQEAPSGKSKFTDKIAYGAKGTFGRVDKNGVAISFGYYRMGKFFSGYNKEINNKDVLNTFGEKVLLDYSYPYSMHDRSNTDRADYTAKKYDVPSGTKKIMTFKVSATLNPIAKSILYDGGEMLSTQVNFYVSATRISNDFDLPLAERAKIYSNGVTPAAIKEASKSYLVYSVGIEINMAME